MKEILLSKDMVLSTKQNIGIKTQDSFSKKYNLNFNHILSFLANSTDLASNLQETIEPNISYRAVFTKEIIEKLNSGEYKIMHSKGEFISTIVNNTYPQKGKIVHQLRLAEEIPNNVHSISQNINNMVLQQGIANMSKQLEIFNQKLDEISKEFLNDRLGIIYGARNTLEQAFICDNDEILIKNAISELNKGRQQLLNSFEKHNKFIDNIPSNFFRYILKTITEKDFKPNCEKIYFDGQLILNGIVESTILLAIAYQTLNKYEPIELIFDPLNKFINNYSNKFYKLEETVSADKLPYNKWYTETEKIINIQNTFKQNTQIQDAENIQLEFNGDDLLKLIGGN